MNPEESNSSGQVSSSNAPGSPPVQDSKALVDQVSGAEKEEQAQSLGQPDVPQPAGVQAAVPHVELPQANLAPTQPAPVEPPQSVHSQSEQPKGNRSILKALLLLLAGAVFLSIAGFAVWTVVTYSAPRDIRVTNVTDQSVTISWRTDKPTPGVVVYSQDQSFLPGVLARFGSKLAYDDRDVSKAELEYYADISGTEGVSMVPAGYDAMAPDLNNYYTHHVTLTGLDPEQQYYFAVGSGLWFSAELDTFANDRYTVSQENVFVTVAMVEDLAVPDPSYGSVVSEDGSAAVDGISYAVVYYNGAETQSAPVSATLNEEGRWYLDLANVRSVSGEVVAFDEESDLENVYVVAGSDLASTPVNIHLNENAPARVITVSSADGLDADSPETEESSGRGLVSYVVAANNCCDDSGWRNEALGGGQCDSEDDWKKGYNDCQAHGCGKCAEGNELCSDVGEACNKEGGCCEGLICNDKNKCVSSNAEGPGQDSDQSGRPSDQTEDTKVGVGEDCTPSNYHTGECLDKSAGESCESPKDFVPGHCPGGAEVVCCAEKIEKNIGDSCAINGKNGTCNIAKACEGGDFKKGHGCQEGFGCCVVASQENSANAGQGNTKRCCCWYEHGESVDETLSEYKDCAAFEFPNSGYESCGEGACQPASANGGTDRDTGGSSSRGGSIPIRPGGHAGEENRRFGAVAQRTSSKSALGTSSSRLVPSVHAAEASYTVTDCLVMTPDENGLYSVTVPGVGVVESVRLVEGQGYTLFVDDNGNGMMDGDEKQLDLCSTLLEVTVDTTESTFELTVSEGLNFVSFEYLPALTDSCELIVDMNAVTTDLGVTMVGRFESGKFQATSYRRDTGTVSGDCFPVVPGRGYVLRSFVDMELLLAGYSLTAPAPVDFNVPGWHLMGINGAGRIYTAESLIDSINAIEGATADNVTKWDAPVSRYEGLQKTGAQVYGFDFPLETGRGYFVRISAGGGVWTPE
ncbi:MAG: fibronectin type III domain-containing protein [Candidatus Dojkabacteria bacterium]|nr:fibronectin type III domain-containing protein [Candidatus Dojkabacteria bacterium]